MHRARRFVGPVILAAFGAQLEGLVRRRFRSRFAAAAVLWRVPAGYSSSSSLLHLHFV
jgi:hypothetical protein